MELKELLLPLVTECRKRFAENSLILVLESVGINSEVNAADPKFSAKQLPANLELLELSSGCNRIHGFSGEVSYWKTEPCKNLQKMILEMDEIGFLNMLPSKILRKVRAWRSRKNNSIALFRFDFINNDGESCPVSDNEVLTFLEYSLHQYVGIQLQIPQVQLVQQIALPIAVFGHLWIAVSGSVTDKITMKLYDFEDCECGYLNGIKMSNEFLESLGKNPGEIKRVSKSSADFKSAENSDAELNNKPDLNPKILGIDGTNDESSEIDFLNPSDPLAQNQEQEIGLKEEIRKLVSVISKRPCNDNQVTFTSLGFDSIKLARLEFALQNKFSGKFLVPYGCAHRYHSVEALSEYILKNGTDENRGLFELNNPPTNFQFLNEKLKEFVRSGAELPLSAAQKRIIFLDQLNPENKARSFFENLTLKLKELDIYQFQKAFNRLVARHTALRTAYTATAQIILSLTEAYFWIRPESARSIPELFMPVDLLYSTTIPLRTIIIPDEGNNRNVESILPNQTYPKETEKILKKEGIVDESCRNFVGTKNEKEAMDSGDIETRRIEVATIQGYLVIIRLHHIAIDGFSIKLLTNELRMLYNENRPLKEVPYQYAHYVLLEEQQRNDSGNRKAREAFWKKLVAETELQTLPVDKTGHQPGQWYSGKSLQFSLDYRTQKCLQNTAICCNVTQFAVLLANFQLLQYKRYGFKDFCAGITVAQRQIPELCSIVGCLLNVVPIMSTIESGDKIQDFLAKSYQRLNESIQKQLPFDDLVLALNLKREQPNLPLFQVLLILDDVSDGTSATDSDGTESDDDNQNPGNFQNQDSNFAQYDQVWYFQYHKKSGITIKIEYNACRFYRNTMEAVVQQYLRLLHKIDRDLHISVEHLKMISSKEEYGNYQLRTANQCDYPRKSTVLELMDKQNRINPYCNQVKQGELIFSHIFLERKSNQFSRYLTQRCLQFSGENLHIDNFALLIFDRSIDFLVTIIAFWKCGIAVIPMNPDIPADHLDKVIEEMNCPVIIYGCKEKGPEDRQDSYVRYPNTDCKKESANPLRYLVTTKQYRGYWLDIDEVSSIISGYSDSQIRRKATQHDLAYMTYTSGSTGTAKGICTEFYGLNNLAVNYAEQLSVSSTSSIYQVVNLSFDIFFADFLEAQTNGARLQLASERIPNLEEMSLVTHAYIMPAYLSAIPIENFRKKLSVLEKVNFGGECIQYKTLQDAIQAGLHFYQQYGTTEHSIYSTFKLMKRGDRVSLVGKPLKNIQFFLRDIDRNLLGQRSTGICCTYGPGISRGYYRNEGLNQKSFFENKDLTKTECLLAYDRRNFWTGDLAEILSNAGGLYIRGRIDFQVKIRGLRVEIPAVEATLEEYELVKKCVICLQKIGNEQTLIAYISLSGGIDSKQQDEPEIKRILCSYLAARFPTHMIPQQYVLLREFPLNANGKIDRKRLPLLLQKPVNLEAHVDSEIRPKYKILRPWEKKVVEIFSKLLPTKVIRLEDSFFDVGGDSLKALIAVQNIKSELGMDLQLRDIFRLSSFKAIVEHLERNYSTNSDDSKKSEGLENLDPMNSGAETFSESRESTMIDNSLVTSTSASNEVLKDSRHLGIETGATHSQCALLSCRTRKIHNIPKTKDKFYLKQDDIPVSLQQERLLFIYSFGNEYRESYRLQLLIRFRGPMNLRILNTSLNYVIQKHTILRTIFSQKAGRTIQEIVSSCECYVEINKNKLRHAQKIADLPDLYSNPLFAIKVDNVSEDNLELRLFLDHLIVDGRSIAILSSDLVEIYNKLAAGKKFSRSSDDEASLIYPEFCLRQRNQLKKLRQASRNPTTEMELQVAEECRVLEEIILKLRSFPPLNVTGDMVSGESNGRRDLIKLKIPISLSVVKAFCGMQRCTLFAYLLCVFSLTMRILENKERRRFAVVSPALNRSSSTMNCVGLFTNTVIIPVDTNYPKISDLIQNLQQNIAASLQLQHIPYEWIIQKLNPERDSIGSEPYRISFVVQNASAIELPKIAGVESAVEEIPGKYANFDQAWYFNEFQDYIEMMAEYRSAKYSSFMMRHTVEVFVKMASEILSNQSAEVKEILASSQLTDQMVLENGKPKGLGEIQEELRENQVLEKALLEIWKEILEDSEISISDNFFSKGGHSLLIPQICYKIKQKLSYKCTPQLIFKYQTVRELAAHIRTKMNLKSTMKTKQDLKFPVCPLQESLISLYFNETMTATDKTPSSASATAASSSSTVAVTSTATTDLRAFQTGFSVFLKAGINLKGLKQALNTTIMNHFALRTTFDHGDGTEFFQIIHSGTEAYIALQKLSNISSPTTLPNPFHSIPIVCWLTCDGSSDEQLSGTNYFELHFQISHAICDGKSLSVVAKELQYNYFENMQKYPVKCQDYIQFSRQLLERFTERRSEMQAFWSRTLDGTEAVKLHPDKTTTSSNNRCKFVRKKYKNLRNLIKNVAVECRCSSFAVQTAAFGKALSGMIPQATGRILISCPVDMRNPETEQCVGMCVNVLPVLINLEHRNLLDLIKDTARNLTDTYLNADISSTEMIKLCEKRGISNFMDVMIVSSYEEISNNRYRLLDDDFGFTKCNLTLFLTQQRENIVAKIEYKEDLFYAETMDTLLGYWAKIIRKMETVVGQLNSKLNLAQPDVTLKDGKKGHHCEYDGSVANGYHESSFRKCDFPGFSFQYLLRQVFMYGASSGKRISLSGNKGSIDYRTLSRRIYQTSRILKQKIMQISGETLRADAVIPVIAQSTVNTLITCLSVLTAGAAYLPIDSTTPAKRIQDILEQIQGNFYVTLDKVPDMGQKCQGIIEINLNGAESSNENLHKFTTRIQNNAADLAYIIFTSGTTGKPKGVAVAQRGLLNMATACTRDFWMKPSDTVYQFTNFIFDNSVLEMTMAIVNGCELLVRENFFMPHEFADALKHSKITHALLFPGLVSTFTNEEIRELRHLRYWIVGAESASASILKCALEAGVNVIQNYGPTETTAYALTRRMKLLDKPNNIGRAILNVGSAVKNSCGEMVPKMAIGELFIKGVGVMRGYVTPSMETKQGEKRNYVTERCDYLKSTSGYAFGTKDVVRLLTNNDILILGRYDLQVKIRGYRIELGEIETILCQYPQIRSAKVILKSAAGQQQQLVAYVISSIPQVVFDPAAVRQFLLQHLPYYMVPTKYYCLRQYPLTNNSKIDIAALKQLPVQDTPRKKRKPENSMEQKLLALFQKLLQNDSISVDDDFFAVGGNSFSAAELVELINENITSCFEVRDVFQNRTVKKLAQRILESREGISEKQESHREDKIPKIDDIPLSFQQQQFWFLNETKERQHYELIFIQKFDASVSLQHLRLAFLRLVLRQLSLRTIFPEQNYEAHQEILSGTEAYFHTSALKTGNIPVEPVSQNEGLMIAEIIKVFQDNEVDIRHQPPVLCAIEITGNRSYVVVLRINHIISDAWSTNLLECDLSCLYQEILENRCFRSNSKLKFTYAEYAINQVQHKEMMEKMGSAYADEIIKWITDYPNYNKILENWKQVGDHKFQNVEDYRNADPETSVWEIPYPKPVVFRNYLEFGFDIRTSKIESICAHLSTTPFSIFLGIITFSLHELSAAKQLIVNVPVANRSSVNSEIIGNFLNFLLICSNFDMSEAAGSSTIPICFDDQNLEPTNSSKITLTRLRWHISILSAATDEIRQYEQIPFVILMDLIRTKLRKLQPLNSEVTELLDRLHKSIFFNFRYGLEQDREAVLGKGEIQAPTDCIHEIEVDVDCLQNDRYCCRIRMKNVSDNEKRIQLLIQRAIFHLRQISADSEIQKTVVDKTRPGEDADPVIKKEKPFLRFSESPKSTDIEEIKSYLRNIWSECIDKKSIRDEDDFFLEGGNSLLTIKLRRRIEAEMGIGIKIEDIFKYSTFGRMSDLLWKRLTDNKHRILERKTSESKIAKEISDSNSRIPEIAAVRSSHEANKNSTSRFIESEGTVNENPWEAEVIEEMEKTRTQTTVRLFHPKQPNVDDSGAAAIIVFFHALVGGVTWTYAPLIRQLIEKIPGQFRMIGVEHPDSFTYKKTPINSNFYRSVESLCSEYVRDLQDHLCKAKLRIFIGASFGALLAYQCAVQLQQHGIDTDEIISIDGVACWRRDTVSPAGLSYEQHRQQITDIVKHRAGDTELSDTLLEAMIDNAWELLKMMKIYDPKESLKVLPVQKFHLTLLRSHLDSAPDNDNEGEDSYGWGDLCDQTVVEIPFSHSNMLDDANAGTIADIIVRAISEAKLKAPYPNTTIG